MWLEVCFLKRNSRKALNIMTSFTLNPLAFPKWVQVCQNQEDAPCRLNLDLQQAGCSYSLQPPPLKTFQLTDYICSSGNKKRTNNNRQLGWRKITSDKRQQVITLMVQAVLATPSIPLLKTTGRFFKEERKLQYQVLERSKRASGRYLVK